MDISQRGDRSDAGTPETSANDNLSQEGPEDRVARRSVELDVAGADLMLRGRFADWDSSLALGSNLDHVGVQLAIDATSASSDAESPSLFSFRSRSVELDSTPGCYRARGVLTGPSGSKPLDVEIKTPPGHSALFVLSFTADRSDFGDGWRNLIEKTDTWGRPAEGEPARQAYAWLLPPVLAAA